MSAPDINFKSKQDITSIVGRDFVVDASKGDFSFESQYFTMESTNTGSPRNLTLTDKDKTVYLKLNKSSMSYLHNDYGFNLTSKTGAINISNNSAQGITINAKAPGNGTNDYVQLKMIAQDGGSASYFALSSQNGSVRATQNLYGTSSGVKISDGFGTEWGVITSTIPGTDEHSLETSKDVYTRDIIFREFNWDNFSYGRQQGTHSLAYIISKLWDEFDSFRTSTNDTLNNHNTRITNAQNKADSAYKLAEGKADASTVTDLSATVKDNATKVRNHYHTIPYGRVITQVNYDTYQYEGMDISHIRSTRTDQVRADGGPVFTA